MRVGSRRYDPERSKIKRRTMERRKKEYLASEAAWQEIKNCLLAGGISCPKCFADVECTSSK